MAGPVTCPDDPGDPMDGKTVLVTGANSGIGLETARVLAAKGARVLLHGRSREKVEAAQVDIAETTGNQALGIVLADLADQDQVRHAAKQVHGLTDRLDALINNAGAVLRERRFTPEGNEAQFAVNHLAPFLLTHELLDLLETTGREHGKARIVNVASEAHWNVKREPDELQSLEGRYKSFPVYSQTKLYNILFTRELDRRLDADTVTVNCLHPGVIGSRFGSDGPWYVRAFMAVARPMLTSPKDGAKTSVYLAASSEATLASGRYFKDCRATTPSKLARDDDLARRLWEESEALTGATDWPETARGQGAETAA